jgi:branched-chain amino acid transport system substrate-binding protein
MKRAITILAGAAALGFYAAAVLPAAAADAPTCGLNTGKPATGQPIPVGAVVGKTGPADFSASARSAEAYFKCVNANGGINGRPIAYTIEDDAWNPEQAAQVASKLVKDQKVVAMVGNSSFVECAANEAMYEKENVLVIAGLGVPRDCFHSRNISPTNEGPRLSNLGAAEYVVKTFNAKKIVCIGPNIPNVGKWGCDGITDWGKSRGVDVQVMLSDPGSLDATSLVLQAMSGNPDMIEVSFPKEQAVAIFAAAEQQDLGSKVKWAGPTSIYNAEFPKAIGPYWDGKVYVELELEPLDKKSPDVLNWHAVLDKYATPSDQRDTFSQAGYIAARVFVDTLLKMDPAKIDRTTVTDAIHNIRGFHTDVACGAYYFGPGDEHNANHAGSVAVVEKGGFVTKESCFQINDPDLADIRKREAELHLAD